MKHQRILPGRRSPFQGTSGVSQAMIGVARPEALRRACTICKESTPFEDLGRATRVTLATHQKIKPGLNKGRLLGAAFDLTVFFISQSDPLTCRR